MSAFQEESEEEEGSHFHRRGDNILKNACLMYQLSSHNPTRFIQLYGRIILLRYAGVTELNRNKVSAQADLVRLTGNRLSAIRFTLPWKD